MNAPKRQSILRGPALAVHRGVPLYTQGDITVDVVGKTDALEVAMFGQIDETDDDVRVEVGFTPSGEATLGLLLYFMQYFNGFWYPGMPVFGAIDYPLVLTTRSGEQLVLTSAALTTPPPIVAVGGKILFGAVKFTGIPANGSGWATANRLFSYQTGQTYPGDAPITGSIAGTSNASPDVITTTAAHGLSAGAMVTISGVQGDTAVNGVFTVATAPSATTLTLYQFLTTTPVAGNGAYVSGGAFTSGGFNLASIVRQPFAGKWLQGALPAGAISADTDANPDVLTSATHGLLAGDTVTISGAVGDGAINGTFTVAPADLTANTFSLYAYGTTNPVAGAGTYTGGATFTRANTGDSFAAFDTEAGWAVTQQVTVTADMSDATGTIGMYFEKAVVGAKAIPVGPSVSDALAMLKAQGAGAARGQSLAARGLPLYLSGAGIYIKILVAALKNPKVMFGVKPKRIGTLEWSAELGFSAGAPAPFLQVSTTPIA